MTSKGERAVLALGNKSNGDGGGRPSEPLLMVEFARSCCTRPLGMSKGDTNERPGPCCCKLGIMWGGGGMYGSGPLGTVGLGMLGNSNADTADCPPLLFGRSIMSKGLVGHACCACQARCCCCCCCCGGCCCCCCWGLAAS